MIRLRLEHAAQVRCSVGVAAAGAVRGAQVPVSSDEVRAEGDRFLEMRDARVDFAQRELGCAQVRERLGPVGIQRERLPQLHFRLLVSPCRHRSAPSAVRARAFSGCFAIVSRQIASSDA